MSEAELKNSIVSMVVEAWRFAGVYQRLRVKLDFAGQKRGDSQFQWFFKKTLEGLEAADMKIAEIPLGLPYDPGLPVTAVNLDEFEPDDQLIIQQILEPTILDSQNHITHIGSVILAKVNKRVITLALTSARLTAPSVPMTAKKHGSGRAPNRMTSRRPRFPTTAAATVSSVSAPIRPLPRTPITRRCSLSV